MFKSWLLKLWICDDREVALLNKSSESKVGGGDNRFFFIYKLGKKLKRWVGTKFNLFGNYTTIIDLKYKGTYEHAEL